MKKVFLIFTFFVTLYVTSQNKQILYDFAELPQTLLLNPALETNYKYHLGIPLLSGFSSEFGSTGFVLSDVFAADGRAINDKVSSFLSKLDTRDHIKINFQEELFNAGFRLDEKTYISFGLYEELDAIAYFPKDVVTLVNEGNASYLNRSFSASQILYKLDFLGVFHAGITRKVNDNLTIGGRFKIYSSALNLESSNNSGTFTTVLGNNNIYTHYLSDINVNLKTAGLIKNEEYIDDPTTYLKNTLLAGNLGVGFDFGVTYKISPQLQFTGSLLDVGFIHHKKNVKNTLTEGDFTFEGIEFEYNSANRNYWNELNEAFKEQLPTTENYNSYISWRPAKLNAALKYSFGEKRGRYCYDNTYKDFYTDSFGAQLYAVFRPLTQHLALTGFYEKSLTKKIHTKITYTVDDYSFSNIGVGLSAQIWKINFYGILDNLLELKDVSSANNMSLQFGINLIFN